MIKLYCAKITDYDQADYTKMYSLLECDIRAKIDKKKCEQDRLQSLLGYILLYKGAKELYGKSRIDITFNDHGKPLCDFCFFSISHSENMAVCAFFDLPIGVDIEKIHFVEKRKKYKIFTEKECGYVNQNEEKTSERYIEIFTKKEAAVKMLGISLAQGQHIDTFANDFLFEIQRYDDFIVTVCTPKAKIM